MHRNAMLLTATAVACAAFSAGTLRAQSAAPGGDPVMQPTDMALRFTPGMARVMARQYARYPLKMRYELPEDQQEAATDIVYNHLMELAGRLDTAEKAAGVEDLITLMMEMELNREDGKFWKHGKRFAGDLLPLMPEIQQFVTDVGKEIRPLLPVKQQLKLAGDMMAAKTAMEAFTTKLESWSEGNIEPGEQPWSQPRDKPVERDEQGRSQALNNAIGGAQAHLQNNLDQNWERYVKDAGKFYNFTPEQANAADSLLREYLDRAAVITSEEQWRNSIYRNRVWRWMMHTLPGGWYHPVGTLLDDEYAGLVAPVKDLGDELKAQIERIPTADQRRTAMSAVADKLAEFGLESVDLQTAVSQR